MQGLFIGNRRPVSKDEVRNILQALPERVYIEPSSLWPGEFEGRATDLPLNKTITCVGPDPYTNPGFTIKITRIGERKFVSE